MSGRPLYIAIVGHPSSGKDTAGEYISTRFGFVAHSTGDVIRKHMKSNKLGAPTRETMTSVGNELRKERGSDFLVRSVMASSGSSDRVIIGGIRSRSEADAVKSVGGIILAVTAPLKTRHERALRRGRIGDSSSLSEFKRIEDQEAQSDDPAKQSVEDIVQRADFVVENSGSLEEFCLSLDEVVERILVAAV
jgi:dephospho-CoA kinase